MSLSRASNSSSGGESMTMGMADDFLGQHHHHSRQRSVASNLALEEIEPYVRRKRSNSASEQSVERTKRRADNMSEEDQNVLRMCINSRERRRMHNLNEALDGLRRVLPRSDNPNQRKISKIATINMATKWISQLTSEMERLKEQRGLLRKDNCVNNNNNNHNNNNNNDVENNTISDWTVCDKTVKSPSLCASSAVNDATISSGPTVASVIENKRPRRKRQRQQPETNDNNGRLGMTQQQIHAHNQHIARMQQQFALFSPLFLQQAAASAAAAAAANASAQISASTANRNPLATSCVVQDQKNETINRTPTVADIWKRNNFNLFNNKNGCNIPTVPSNLLNLRQLAVISAATMNMLNVAKQGNTTATNSSAVTASLSQPPTLESESSPISHPSSASCETSSVLNTVIDESSLVESAHQSSSTCLCVSCLLSSSPAGDNNLIHSSAELKPDSRMCDDTIFFGVSKDDSIFSMEYAKCNGGENPAKFQKVLQSEIQ